MSCSSHTQVGLVLESEKPGKYVVYELAWGRRAAGYRYACSSIQCLKISRDWHTFHNSRCLCTILRHENPGIIYSLDSALCATSAINAAPNPLPSFASPILILFSPSTPISGISLKVSLI